MGWRPAPLVRVAVSPAGVESAGWCSRRACAPSRRARRSAGKESVHATLLHGQVAQVPLKLKAVNAQHGLHCKVRVTAQGLVRSAGMRLAQRHQRRPGHNLAHLLKEDLLARLRGQRIEAEVDLVHGSWTQSPLIGCLLARYRVERFCRSSLTVSGRQGEAPSSIAPKNHSLINRWYSHRV